ncbi:hypothetical protein IAE_17374 [Escherichia coli XH140A]|nr:hypothetical protein IAE_17374 [Escherichia coli XH140A]
MTTMAIMAISGLILQVQIHQPLTKITPQRAHRHTKLSGKLTHTQRFPCHQTADYQ